VLPLLRNQEGTVIRALRNNVLLKLLPKEPEGSILLVESDKHKERAKRHVRAEVISAGPGTKAFSVDVLPGDTVLVPELCGELWLAGVQLPVSAFPEGTETGDEFRMVRETEIIGVLV
jgi:co-chaperonin GroES (HSP10)